MLDQRQVGPHAAATPAGARSGRPYAVPCDPSRGGCATAPGAQASSARIWENYQACLRNADSGEDEGRCLHPDDPLLRGPTAFNPEWEAYTRCLRNADRDNERKRCVEPPLPVDANDAMAGCEAPFHRCDPVRGGSVPPIEPSP